MFLINYHTGAGNTKEKTLDLAMKKADKEAAYTQQNITIENEAGAVVAVRKWWGVRYDPNQTEDAPEDVIQFGDFGYYGAWETF